jgi:hypothetical protein
MKYINAGQAMLFTAHETGNLPSDVHIDTTLQSRPTKAKYSLIKSITYDVLSRKRWALPNE